MKEEEQRDGGMKEEEQRDGGVKEEEQRWWNEGRGTEMVE